MIHIKFVSIDVLKIDIYIVLFYFFGRCDTQCEFFTPSNKIGQS